MNLAIPSACRPATLLAPAMLAVVAALTVLAATASAEEAVGARPTGLEPVPADQIPARANSVRVTLESIRSRAEAVRPPEKDQLGTVAVAIDRVRQHPDFGRLDTLPEFRIAELFRQVRFYRVELEAVEARDIARASRLSADAAELSRLRGAWTTTLETAQKEKLAFPLVDEIRTVLGQIENTERVLSQPLARALADRERASRYETRLEALSRTLGDAADRAKVRRLSRDVPPIWAKDALVLSPERGLASIKARIDEQVRFSRDYFEARRRGGEALALVAGLALVGMFWARRRSAWLLAAGEQASDASRVLKRPYSSLLLVLLVGTLIEAELAPPIVAESGSMLIMLVLLRLMPQRLVAGHPVLLLGLAVLFMLDRGRAMMPFDSVAFRLDQLVVAAGLASGYGYILWLHRQGRVPARSWLALLMRVAPLAVLLLMAAAASNLLGNLSLADILVRGTLTSTFVSAILFAAAFILDDFIRMMVRSPAGQHLRMIVMRGEVIVNAATRIIRAGALLGWLWITLWVFQLWQPVAARLDLILGARLTVGELDFTLGGVLTFTVGVFIAVYAARTVRFLLAEEILTRVSWPVGAKSTTATLSYYGVLLGGLLLAFNAAGIATSQFAIIIGALGVGIGFGLQNVVNNFVSGLILMFERPVQPGDIIDIDNLQGQVVTIGLRATRVKTWEGAEVVVPNGTLLSGNLVNWTLSDSSRRVEVPVGVAYGTNVRRVLEILLDVAKSQEAAMSEPAPVVLFLGFGDSSLDFVMRFWTRDAATAVAARSEAATAIAEAFAKEDIEIPFPQRDLHLRSVSPEATEALRS